MGKASWLKTWAIRGFVILAALSALAGSSASSQTELAGSVLVYIAIIYAAFRWTGTSGSEEAGDDAA